MLTVTSANQMFTSCGSLETIYATSFSNSGLSGSLMFNSCRSLVGGNGTAWTSSNASYTYMRIDEAGQAGYLTAA